jgi:hypothetical protein
MSRKHEETKKEMDGRWWLRESPAGRGEVKNGYDHLQLFTSPRMYVRLVGIAQYPCGYIPEDFTKQLIDFLALM